MSPPAIASPRASFLFECLSSSGSGANSTSWVGPLCPPPHISISVASPRMSENRREYVSRTSSAHSFETTCFARLLCTSIMFVCTHSKKERYGLCAFFGSENALALIPAAPPLTFSIKPASAFTLSSRSRILLSFSVISASGSSSSTPQGSGSGSARSARRARRSVTAAAEASEESSEEASSRWPVVFVNSILVTCESSMSSGPQSCLISRSHAPSGWRSSRPLKLAIVADCAW